MDPEYCWGTRPGRRDARPPSRPHLSPSDSRTSILGSSQNHLQSLLFSQEPGNPGFQVKMFSRAPRQPRTGQWSQGPSPRPCCPSMAEWGSAAVVLLGEGPGPLSWDAQGAACLLTASSFLSGPGVDAERLPMPPPHTIQPQFACLLANHLLGQQAR